jgi:Derlin-1
MDNMWRTLRIACFLAATLLQATPGTASLPFFPSRFGKTIISVSKHHQECGISSNVLLCTRGGASKKSAKTKRSSTKRTATGQKQVGAEKAEEKSAVGDAVEWLKTVKPLTRIHLIMAGLFTGLGVVLGEELAQGLFAFDPMRVLYGFEVWRPLTAASYLGKPSVSMIFSFYYLFNYGSTLERTFGTPQHLVFLLTQMVLLTILSALLRQPFFSQSLITAMLHVLSRSAPKQKVNWMMFNIPYVLLPYAFMLSDMLQQEGNMMAILPHAVGILSGHFYFFHKFIWPKEEGGEDWLKAPDFLVKLMTTEKPKPVVAASSKRKKGRKVTSSTK